MASSSSSNTSNKDIDPEQLNELVHVRSPLATTGPHGALQGYVQLPSYPASRQDYEQWASWSKQQFTLRRAPVLRLRDERGLGEEERNRLHVAWRALIGQWAGGRGVGPDDAPLIMYHLLVHAHQAPPFVLLAARRLARSTLLAGATSSDALFLLATFVWPLRDVDEELSEQAWQFLIHAPWQSDPLTQRDLIIAVNQHGAWRDGRGLMELVNARHDAGLIASTRSFLEAIALVQTRKEQVEQIQSYKDFLSVELVHDAHRAIVRLAHLYMQQEEDQIYAREVLKRAAELTRSRALIHHIERRAWDRPLDEIYQWTEYLAHPRHLDHEIKFALSHGQPHHARRIAEAVIIRKYKKLWYGSALDNLHGALERFEKEIEGIPTVDPVSRRAAEHLATLYVRTHHVTQHARSFVHAVASSIAFTGKGAELYDIRDELELFFNRSDPYHVLRHEATLINARQHALRDDEKAASDEVQRWFSERFRPEQSTTLERLARYLTSPVTDVARYVTTLPYLEDICTAAFRTIVERSDRLAGDGIGAIAQRAAEIRSKYGHGMQLIEYARSVTRKEVIAASLIASSTSFMPPGLSLLTHATDLGSSLLLAFRAVARVAAVFGRDLSSPDGIQFLADAFAIGLSSQDGEGLLTYLSREQERQVHRAITIGGVGYGTARMVEYLWTAPATDGGVKYSEQFVRQLARLCGFELQHQTAVKIVPMIGALLSGLSTYAFMHMITEAAIHVAARDALLVRAQSYEQS